MYTKILKTLPITAANLDGQREIKVKEYIADAAKKFEKKFQAALQ